MSKPDPYRAVADALVAALAGAEGDVAAEEAALRAAIAGYMDLAEGDDPYEAGVADYFAEDGSVQNPPALERVPGASEDDIFRWREMLLDLMDE